LILFDKTGPENTDRVVEAALNRAEELQVEEIVVASNTGETASKFLGKGKEVVCVTHHVGFRNPGEDEMDPELRQKLQDEGAKVLTATHLFAGVDRALRYRYQGVFPAEIVAATLRILGKGVKVCAEISCMALDAGLVPYGKEIVAVGGSAQGADTAVVIVPAHSNYFFESEIKEIICMPRNK